MVREPMHETTVLVIDDEESIREGCRHLLEYQGYRVVTARNGEQGLRLVERTRPDVALLDLRMPGMNGMEVLRRIREVAPDVLVIIITGYATLESAAEAMQLGACDYLCKPIDEWQLLAAVEDGLEKRRSGAVPGSHGTGKPRTHFEQSNLTCLRGREAK